MELKLERLEYQERAIRSVVSIFTGQEKNNFDNATFEGIRYNKLSLSVDEYIANIQNIVNENGISNDVAKISDSIDICVEMETGTGKTLVYLKTIYELYKRYGFTKFIIIVPSVAIKEGVLQTYEIFNKQLEAVYNVKPNCFEYDSKKLSKVKNFIEEHHPQIMLMTLQSFNSDDRILNQAQREDLFANIPYVQALANTRPIIFMDEPQEGMDTENSIERIKTINPLAKIRYSATHKIISNLIFRLTPYDSYKQGIVKKIEVLTVSEKNDEASMKIELNSIDIKIGKSPQAILKVWHLTNKGAFAFKNTKKLSEKAKLFEITSNVIYKDYVVERIAKPIRGKGFVQFTNGVTIYEGDQAKDLSTIFSEQLYWLIDTHFRKKEKLKTIGIKCLSLIFIDRVANYTDADGIIKIAFEEQFKKVYKAHYGNDADKDLIRNSQGYYFAKSGKGDYTDGEGGIKEQKKLYDLILKDKEALLNFDSPVEFIFSHSALGVGWDNPNVFNIATLNMSYSEIKKRQEIGRGLRICVNQSGQRVYDKIGADDSDEINLLTVIPNESYETFVSQYQSEIEEVYGSSNYAAETRNNFKGDRISEKRINRNDSIFKSRPFKEFWNKLAKKTDYLVSFDENKIIELAINELNAIEIPDYQLRISLGRITDISHAGIETSDFRSEYIKSNIQFANIDLVEEISENTALAYPTVFKIISALNNRGEIAKNPPRFIQEAVKRIKNIELDEMLRGLSYKISGEFFDFDLFDEFIIRNADRILPTPNKSVYDHVVFDSDIERNFALAADNDSEIVCFLKLPAFYVIKTPAGDYNPDFGLVLKKKKIREDEDSEFYFVIETKGTNDINDRAALKESEIYKIKCAIKHFEALGIEAKADKDIKYLAPIKDYYSFKNKSEN